MQDRLDYPCEVLYHLGRFNLFLENTEKLVVHYVLKQVANRVSTYKAVCHGVLQQITIKHDIEAICRPLQGAAETKRYHFRIISLISVFKFVISTFQDICSDTFTNLPIICFCSQIFIT